MSGRARSRAAGPAAQRGRDFGFHRALDTLGAAVGPLTAWAILTLVPDGYRTVFWVSAIPGTLAIVVVFAAVREVGARRGEAAACGGGAPATPRFRLRHLGRPFALFTGASAVFALGNSSDALLILRALDVGAAPALMAAAAVLMLLVPAGQAGESGTAGRRRA